MVRLRSRSHSKSVESYRQRRNDTNRSKQQSHRNGSPLIDSRRLSSQAEGRVAHMTERKKLLSASSERKTNNSRTRYGKLRGVSPSPIKRGKPSEISPGRRRASISTLSIGKAGGSRVSPITDDRRRVKRSISLNRTRNSSTSSDRSSCSATARQPKTLPVDRHVVDNRTTRDARLAGPQCKAVNKRMISDVKDDCRNRNVTTKATTSYGHRRTNRDASQGSNDNNKRMSNGGNISKPRIASSPNDNSSRGCSRSTSRHGITNDSSKGPITSWQERSAEEINRNRSGTTQNTDGIATVKRYGSAAIRGDRKRMRDDSSPPRRSSERNTDVISDKDQTRYGQRAHHTGEPLKKRVASEAVGVKCGAVLDQRGENNSEFKKAQNGENKKPLESDCVVLSVDDDNSDTQETMDVQNESGNLANDPRVQHEKPSSKATAKLPSEPSRFPSASLSELTERKNVNTRGSTSRRSSVEDKALILSKHDDWDIPSKLGVSNVDANDVVATGKNYESVNKRTAAQTFGDCDVKATNNRRVIKAITVDDDENMVTKRNAPRRGKSKDDDIRLGALSGIVAADNNLRDTGIVRSDSRDFIEVVSSDEADDTTSPQRDRSIDVKSGSTGMTDDLKSKGSSDIKDSCDGLSVARGISCSTDIVARKVVVDDMRERRERSKSRDSGVSCKESPRNRLSTQKNGSVIPDAHERKESEDIPLVTLPTPTSLKSFPTPSTDRSSYRASLNGEQANRGPHQKCDRFNNSNRLSNDDNRRPVGRWQNRIPPHYRNTGPGHVAVDRSIICPFLLRVFYRLNGHHDVCDFATRGREPVSEEMQIYTWLDATLREIVDLIKDVSPEARDRNVTLKFLSIHPNRRGHGMASTVLGSVHSTRASAEDRKTLQSADFRIGDYLDLAIILGRSSINGVYGMPQAVNGSNTKTVTGCEVDDRPSPRSPADHEAAAGEEIMNAGEATSEYGENTNETDDCLGNSKDIVGVEGTECGSDAAVARSCLPKPLDIGKIDADLL